MAYKAVVTIAFILHYPFLRFSALLPHIFMGHFMGFIMGLPGSASFKPKRLRHPDDIPLSDWTEIP